MGNKCFTPEQIKEFGYEGLSATEIAQDVSKRLEDSEINIKLAKVDAIMFARAEEIVLSYKRPPFWKRVFGNNELVSDPKAGLQAFVTRDIYEMPRVTKEGISQGGDLEHKMRAVNSAYQRKLYDMMEELQPKVFGLFTQRELGDEMIRAIKGESTNSRFNDFAKQWKKVTQELLERYNVVTQGRLRNKADWDVNQNSDPYKVRRSGFEEWSKIVKETTTERKLSEMGKDVDDILKKVYNDIVSEGVDSARDIYGKVQKGGGGMSAMHERQRFLEFKDADSWIRYNKEFSDLDPYGSMMDYITMMTNDIAMMETLGYNFQDNFDALAKSVDRAASKQNASSPGLLKKNAGDAGRHAFANLAGRTNPVNRRASDIMQSLRNWTVFAKLPGAVLSAPSDMIANLINSRYLGLNGIRSMSESIKKLATANTPASRKMAAKLGMQLSFMIDSASTANRYSDVTGQTISSKAASLTIKGGGLNHWTVAQKMGFTFGFFNGLTEKSIVKGKQMGLAFERYGITKEEIDIIANSESFTNGGVNFLDLDKMDSKLSEKIMAMSQAELKLAVPEADARVRGFLNQGTQKGTGGGEILRLFSIFKTFPATIAIGNWSRVLHGQGYSSVGRVRTAANLAIGMTVLGAMSLQLKEIAKGEPISPMDNDKFWRGAAIQGGAGSIIADIFSSDSRKYGSMADFVGGPTIGMIDDIFWKGALGSLDDARDADRKMTSMSEIINKRARATGTALFRNFAPGQFFYTKYIFHSALQDEVERWNDPKYDLKKARRQRKKLKEFQEEKW